MKLATLLPAVPCKGTTQAGKPCNAKDVYQNGRCKHHGGEGQSMTAQRLELAIELAKLKAQRPGRKAIFHAAKLRILEAQKAIRDKENALRQNQA